MDGNNIVGRLPGTLSTCLMRYTDPRSTPQCRSSQPGKAKLPYHHPLSVRKLVPAHVPRVAHVCCRCYYDRLPRSPRTWLGRHQLERSHRWMSSKTWQLAVLAKGFTSTNLRWSKVNGELWDGGFAASCQRAPMLAVRGRARGSYGAQPTFSLTYCIFPPVKRNYRFDRKYVDVDVR